MLNPILAEVPLCINDFLLGVGGACVWQIITCISSVAFPSHTMLSHITPCLVTALDMGAKPSNASTSSTTPTVTTKAPITPRACFYDDQVCAVTCLADACQTNDITLINNNNRWMENARSAIIRDLVCV
jgi:hypothetical protein